MDFLERNIHISLFNSHINFMGCFRLLLYSLVFAGNKPQGLFCVWMHFIKYIEWPEESKKGDFVIAFTGNLLITAEFKTLATSKKAIGQKTYRKLWKNQNMSALLVAEREGLAKKGAGINFDTLEDNTLKFEVNKKSD